jgi:N-methylhydantoinase B
VLKGQLVRVATTGGGGWGDPLEREPELVQCDVDEGKVSLAAARDVYGVVLVEAPPDCYQIDAPATAQLRDALRNRRHGQPLPMIDRGAGYQAMLRADDAPTGQKV